MKIVGIIPARFASTRFPGKPLADIGGKTMIQRVYEQAGQALEHVFVATDDPRIKNVVESFGGKVIMTSPAQRSGTSRCAEAVEILEQQEPVEVVVNIQGDEPFIEPESIRKLAAAFDSPDTQIATLVKHETDMAAILSPNTAKVVLDNRWQAMYFSRSPIPHLRNVEQTNWADNHRFWRHLGLYAYRTDVLKQLVNLQPSALELAESLEQNCWLENGFKISVVETQSESLAVDTPEDLQQILASGLL